MNVDTPHRHHNMRPITDTTLLIPHEAIRRETNAMEKSILALNPDAPESDAWKAINFSKWYLEFYYNSIHDHHDSEELLYFPYIAQRAELPERLAADHVELIGVLNDFKASCETIIKEGGRGDATKEAIKNIQAKFTPFKESMFAHLKEEETITPPILREHFTEEDNNRVVQQIIKRGGLNEARHFLPSIVLAVREWGGAGLQAGFQGELPGPISHLLTNYYLPDYQNAGVKLRDSPQYDQEPEIRYTPCCGWPCCCCRCWC